MIAKRYMRSWFAIDVLSCLPVTYVALIVGGPTDISSSLRGVKAVRLARLSKLLRLARVVKLLHKYEDSMGKALNASALLIAAMLAAHMLACGWYYVGSLCSSEPCSAGKQGWSYAQYTNTSTPHISRYLTALSGILLGSRIWG